jgi:hypothetical protein
VDHNGPAYTRPSTVRYTDILHLVSVQAGAAFGTGYCDAQCPHDLKYVAGEANCKDWKPSTNDANSGTVQLYSTISLEHQCWPVAIITLF